MRIVELVRGDDNYIKQAASLLATCFPDSYGDSAMQEMKKCLSDDRLAFISLTGNEVVGFIGAIPQYGVTGWELHPLVVRPDVQKRGIGTALIRVLEREVAQRGGVTIYLGSDDEFGKTSLSGVDLYKSLHKKIKSIKNINEHPYEFYEKMGYKIVGVFPDVNGIGKPDIWLAKRVSGN